MKVLITGATGLVGNELVSLLLKNGIYINYLTTSEKKIQNEEKYKGFLWNPEKGEIDFNCIIVLLFDIANSFIHIHYTSFIDTQMFSRSIPDLS